MLQVLDRDHDVGRDRLGDVEDLLRDVQLNVLQIAEHFWARQQPNPRAMNGERLLEHRAVDVAALANEFEESVLRR